MYGIGRLKNSGHPHKTTLIHPNIKRTKYIIVRINRTLIGR